MSIAKRDKAKKALETLRKAKGHYGWVLNGSANNCWAPRIVQEC